MSCQLKYCDDCGRTMFADDMQDDGTCPKCFKRRTKPEFTDEELDVIHTALLLCAHPYADKHWRSLRDKIMDRIDKYLEEK